MAQASQKSVSPAVAAIVIILAIIIVVAIGWYFLAPKGGPGALPPGPLKPPGPAGGGPAPGPMPAPEPAPMQPGTQ